MIGTWWRCSCFKSHRFYLFIILLWIFFYFPSFVCRICGPFETVRNGHLAWDSRHFYTHTTPPLLLLMLWSCPFRLRPQLCMLRLLLARLSGNKKIRKLKTRTVTTRWTSFSPFFSAKIHKLFGFVIFLLPFFFSQSSLFLLSPFSAPKIYTRKKNHHECVPAE